MINTLRLLCLAAAASAIAGCNVFGKSSFDCPNLEVGATCMSARQIYERTHVADRVGPNYVDGQRISERGAASDPQVAPAAAPAAGAAAAAAPATAPSTATVAQVATSRTYLPPLPEADAPLPVRMPAQVMRIRIFPWEDNAGDLQTGGFVYTEVKGRTWTLGDDQISRVQANVINPLAAPVRPAGQTAAPMAAPSSLLPPRAAQPSNGPSPAVRPAAPARPTTVPAQPQ